MKAELRSLRAAIGSLQKVSIDQQRRIKGLETGLTAVMEAQLATTPADPVERAERLFSEPSDVQRPVSSLYIEEALVSPAGAGPNGANQTDAPAAKAGKE